MRSESSIKAIIISFDEKSEALVISTAEELNLPKDALGVVSVSTDELVNIGQQESERRITGTILGILEVFHQRKIVDFDKH